MKKTVFLLALAAAVVPVRAQDHTMTFNMGGGITTPLNPTAQYSGTSGNFTAAAGYRINRSHAIIGEFMWAGLPPSLNPLHPVGAPYGNVNLYSLTANYRRDFDRIKGSRFGVYTILGGGWYYRYAQIDKEYVAPSTAACVPIYNWWGYVCDSSGGVITRTIAFRGSSAGGLNGGFGFNVGLGDSRWKFYTEARYHYAFHSNVASTLIPVTFGIKFN